MQSFGGANFFGKFQARGIHVGDISRGRSRGAQSLQREQANHSGAENEGSIARRNFRESDRVDRYGYRFQHGRLGKRKTVRQAIHNSLRNDDVFGERSSATVVGAGNSEDAAVVAEIDFTTNAIPAGSARNCGIEGDAIAFGPAGYLWSSFRDAAGSFMAHHDGRNAAARGAVVTVHITAANAARRHFDQNFAGPRSWVGEIGNLQVTILGKQQGLHTNFL